mgnify:CR=1 FL=1
MTENEIMIQKKNAFKIITAGPTYLDIDAYACAVALAELLVLKGENAVAYSSAPCNYSVCDFLKEDGQILKKLPENIAEENTEYIIVDVSDPDFLKTSVPLEKVCAVYDHHPGFEAYWREQIGDAARIEFIGAAATLIYRQWKNEGLEEKMKNSTAKLLVAAILDNTLNLTSSNTTDEDIAAFRELCNKAGIGEEWCASYFSGVQSDVEADLKNALFKDIKNIRNNPVLPPLVAQICVWDTESILSKLSEIRALFDGTEYAWMINIIDIKHRCSYFVCDDVFYQKKIELLFGISFDAGVAKNDASYLRKEIIKKTLLCK